MAFPGVDHLRPKLFGNLQSNRDTTHLRREHAGNAAHAFRQEAVMDNLRHSPGELGINLMIEKTIHFDDTAADMLSLIENSLYQFLHFASRNIGRMLAC